MGRRRSSLQGLSRAEVDEDESINNSMTTVEPIDENKRRMPRQLGTLLLVVLIVTLGMIQIMDVMPQLLVQSTVSERDSGETKLHVLRRVEETVMPLPSQERPIFMLLRTIGNSLPPRHSPNQTLSNLEFVLKHEIDHPQLKKHWLINRIVDPVVEKQIIDLLESYKAAYSIVPFELNEYAATKFRVLMTRGSDLVHQAFHSVASDWYRMEIKSWIYEPKIFYTMSINEARNMLIEFGIQSGARWILPFDQNCFLTENSWEQILRNISAHGDTDKYFVTWMDRIHGSNEDLLKSNYQPNAWEEPQIIFRNDAIERFDEELRYGRRDKAALLVRLNIPGPWWNWRWNAWERKRSFENISRDFNDKVKNAGWVARLNSGRPEQEMKGTGSKREKARSDAIFTLLNKLDDDVMKQIHHFSPTRWTFYDPNFLAVLKKQYKTQTLVDFASSLTVESIIKDARSVLSAGPWSVVNKQKRPPSQNIADYFSPLTVSGTGLSMDINSDKFKLESLLYSTTALTLAWYLTDEVAFVEKAIRNLQVWFIDRGTRMNPNLDFSMHLKSNFFGELGGIAETRYFVFFLDMIRLVSESGRMKTTDHQALIDWFSQFQTYLQQSPHMKKCFHNADVEGLYYDMQVAAMSAFTGQTREYSYVSETVSSRMTSHFLRNGTIIYPNHIVGESLKKKLEYTRQLFEAWALMGKTAVGAGSDVWKFTIQFGKNGKASEQSTEESILCLAYRVNMPCCNGKEDICEYIKGSANAPLYQWVTRAAINHCPMLKDIQSCFDLAFVTPVITSGRHSQQFGLPPYLLVEDGGRNAYSSNSL